MIPRIAEDAVKWEQNPSPLILVLNMYTELLLKLIENFESGSSDLSSRKMVAVNRIEW